MLKASLDTDAALSGLDAVKDDLWQRACIKAGAMTPGAPIPKLIALVSQTKRQVLLIFAASINRWLLKNHSCSLDDFPDWKSNPLFCFKQGGATMIKGRLGAAIKQYYAEKELALRELKGPLKDRLWHDAFHAAGLTEVKALADLTPDGRELVIPQFTAAVNNWLHSRWLSLSCYVKTCKHTPLFFIPSGDNRVATNGRLGLAMQHYLECRRLRIQKKRTAAAGGSACAAPPSTDIEVKQEHHDSTKGSICPGR